MSPRQDPALIDELRPHIVVTAPGVPLSLPIFDRARSFGIPVYGENDFAYHLLNISGRRMPFVIGITGTDGKSTTTALLAHLIAEGAGLSALPCGNYGLPLSQMVLEGKDYDALVVELSSYQLEPLTHFHPQISILLNVAEDHMDRYSGREGYLRAKLRILELQNDRDLFLSSGSLIEEAAASRREIAKADGPVMRDIDTIERPFGLPFEEFAARMGLRGIHNLRNLRFALVALENMMERLLIRPERGRLLSAVERFRGLPHRFETVLERGPLLFINDSKATTVHAVVSALESIPDRRVFLLLGGKNKGLDFTELNRYTGRVEFFCFGESGPEIAEMLQSPIVYPGLEEAFRAALARMTGAADGVLLLSPGCASFDAYGSYAERGEHFRRLVTACGI
jgi:UDP-N-acetylmuramoylalanine--D-glutamate ligase